ncbi:hypothetical protein LSH36_164g07000 [Paralvinella palmiformis]|uniref:Uncharacterized protein n=1 Tax=Paralvinella palmiformis TaxID=53620 RepID=A0AAD9N7Z9_9ANNE|nr:hypothetical protein LSH36_164g07000 [Paralvinella palmiformis]
MTAAIPIDIMHCAMVNSTGDLSSNRAVQEDGHPRQVSTALNDLEPYITIRNSAEHLREDSECATEDEPRRLQEPQNLDDLVLRLMEQCQVESNSDVNVPDIEHTIAVSVDVRDNDSNADACANAGHRKPSKQDSQNAISITNFDIPGCIANTSRTKQKRKRRQPKALKVINNRKVITSNMTAKKGRQVETPLSGPGKLRYYDFSARSLGEMCESRDRSVEDDSERESAAKVNAEDHDRQVPKTGRKVVKNRFDLRRLLRLFDKGSVPDSTWDAYKLSARRGHLQEGRIHRSPKDTDSSAQNSNNINRLLLSVTGRRYQEMSTRERLTVLSSYYESKVKPENTWGSASGRNLSKTPGELAILLGRALNKKQVALYRKSYLPPKPHSDVDTSSVDDPEARSLATTPPRRTCHISVHLPVIQKEPSYDTRHSEREFRADRVAYDTCDTCLDIEGHFPPTIDRHVSRIGKLVSGCRGHSNQKHNHTASRDDINSAEMNIVKLPIISPDGSVTSGGMIRRQQTMNRNDCKSPRHVDLEDYSILSQACLPEAPPGTPVSLSSMSLWPSGQSVLDRTSTFRRSSMPDDTVTPYSSLAAIPDVDQSADESDISAKIAALFTPVDLHEEDEDNPAS